jgi:hypothetical protein
MQRIGYILFVCLLAFDIGYAATGDMYIIHMKDGSTIKGKIVGRNANSLSVSDGSLVMEIPTKNIDKAQVIQEPANEKNSEPTIDQRKQLVDEYSKKMKNSGESVTYENNDQSKISSKPQINVQNNKVSDVADISLKPYIFNSEVDCVKQQAICENFYESQYGQIIESQKKKLSGITSKDCRERGQKCYDNGGMTSRDKSEACRLQENECNNRVYEENIAISNLKNSLISRGRKDCETQEHLCNDRELKIIAANIGKSEQKSVDNKTQNAIQVHTDPSELQNFKKEHSDYVDINGFQYLKFGLQKQAIDKILQEKGITGNQYLDRNSLFIVERLPVFGQEVHSQLVYEGEENTLDKISIGTMDDFGLGGPQTGIVFMDFDKENMKETPSCAEAEKLIKNTLHNYKNVDYHLKHNVINPATGSNVDIESYVLNYGTIIMKIRRFDIPALKRMEQKMQTGWSAKSMTIISLEYNSLSKGLSNLESIKKMQSTEKSNGINNQSSF